MDDAAPDAITDGVELPTATAPPHLRDGGPDQDSLYSPDLYQMVAGDSVEVADWIPVEQEQPRSVLDLHASRRFRTLVIVNGQDSTLGYAHIQVAARLGAGGNDLARRLQSLTYGESLPHRSPFTIQMSYIPTDGWMPRDQLWRYSILFGDMGLSPEELVEYVSQGGVVFGGPRDLRGFAEILRSEFGDHVSLRTLPIEHPLYRSHYQILAFAAGGPSCGALGPVLVVMIDQRIVATESLPYIVDRPCIANKLYVNTLAYLLAQPSALSMRLVVEGKSLGSQYEPLTHSTY